MQKQSSEPLVWELIKKNHAYLAKRNGIKFSFEPGNLTCLHKNRYSGIACPRHVDLRISGDGKGLQMRLKRERVSRKVGKSWHKANIHRDGHTFRSIRHVLKAGKYRRDLMGPAQRKAFFLMRSIQRHQNNLRTFRKKAQHKKAVRAKRAHKK